MDYQTALIAIRARIHGEYDNPELIAALPALGTVTEDILQIIDDALQMSRRTRA